MELSVERVDVWAATIEDKPGGLAKVLSALRDAGADLQGSDVMDDSRPSGFGICQSGEVVTSTAKERSS